LCRREALLGRNWIRDILVFRFLQLNRATALVLAGVLIALIALVDWRFDVNISFGFLYLFPMLLVGGCLTRWQIGAVAVLCTLLTEAFDAFPWAMNVGIPRVILTFAAFFGTGLYGYAAARSRQLASQHLEEITEEMELRRQTEEQLEFVISSSPATIFTVDSLGRVLLANEAAHRLLGVEKGNLQGQVISRFFPALATVPASLEAPFFHTEMECRGRRQDGTVFLAHIWFSTYRTMSGPRLAAVVFDASEELRDRAEFSWQQILTGSKVAVGALCHEIRNICGAIAVVHSKLAREARFGFNEDFRALGTLVEGLEKMAGLELRHSAPPGAEATDLQSVLEELRIVIEPSFEESGMSVVWEVPEVVPRIWADHHTLLQAFLNIAKNSQRALEQQPRKELTVRVSVEGKCIAVRFIDTGPGVPHPDELFAPFQPGAAATGLGLYLSRSFVRAFQGEIEHEPAELGSCFAVMLTRVAEQETEIAAAV
jgi:two-component system, LuxR family, sensor kinase FixL